MTPSQPPTRDALDARDWKRRNPFNKSNTSNKSDQRAWPRFPSHVRTYCQPVKGEDELLWSVRVEEVSCQGLKLISHRRFDPGTVLRIGLLRDKAGLLMAKAVHVSPTPEGDWAIGCTFPKKLKEEELRAWLEQE